MDYEAVLIEVSDNLIAGKFNIDELVFSETLSSLYIPNRPLFLEIDNKNYISFNKEIFYKVFKNNVNELDDNNLDYLSDEIWWSLYKVKSFGRRQPLDFVIPGIKIKPRSDDSLQLYNGIMNPGSPVIYKVKNYLNVVFLLYLYEGYVKNRLIKDLNNVLTGKYEDIVVSWSLINNYPDWKSLIQLPRALTRENTSEDEVLSLIRLDCVTVVDTIRDLIFIKNTNSTQLFNKGSLSISKLYKKADEYSYMWSNEMASFLIDLRKALFPLTIYYYILNLAHEKLITWKS